MVCTDYMTAYWMGYNGNGFIGVMDPCYGAWLDGYNQRRIDDEAPAEPVPEKRWRPYPVPGPQDNDDDLSFPEYVLALIVLPIGVGLTVLLVAFLAGWDHTKWAVVSSAGTFALLLVAGVVEWWAEVLALALLVTVGWWVLHMIGVVPGLPG